MVMLMMTLIKIAAAGAVDRELIYIGCAHISPRARACAWAGARARARARGRARACGRARAGARTGKRRVGSGWGSKGQRLLIKIL